MHICECVQRIHGDKLNPQGETTGSQRKKATILRPTKIGLISKFWLPTGLHGIVYVMFHGRIQISWNFGACARRLYQAPHKREPGFKPKLWSYLNICCAVKVHYLKFTCTELLSMWCPCFAIHISCRPAVQGMLFNIDVTWVHGSVLSDSARTTWSAGFSSGDQTLLIIDPNFKGLEELNDTTCLYLCCRTKSIRRRKQGKMSVMNSSCPLSFSNTVGILEEDSPSSSYQPFFVPKAPHMNMHMSPWLLLLFKGASSNNVL